MDFTYITDSHESAKMVPYPVGAYDPFREFWGGQIFRDLSLAFVIYEIYINLVFWANM